MMKCKDFKELIDAYIDNGLDPMKDEEILRHINDCSGCRDYLQFRVKYAAEVKGFKRHNAPAGFTESVERRLRERAESKFNMRVLAEPFVFLRSRFSIEAMALAGLALIMVIVYRPFTVEHKSVSEIEIADRTVTVSEKVRDEKPAAENKRLRTQVKKESVMKDKAVMNDIIEKEAGSDKNTIVSESIKSYEPKRALEKSGGEKIQNKKAMDLADAKSDIQGEEAYSEKKSVSRYRKASKSMPASIPVQKNPEQDKIEALLRGHEILIVELKNISENEYLCTMVVKNEDLKKIIVKLGNSYSVTVVKTKTEETVSEIDLKLKKK